MNGTVRPKLKIVSFTKRETETERQSRTMRELRACTLACIGSDDTATKMVDGYGDYQIWHEPTSGDYIVKHYGEPICRCEVTSEYQHPYQADRIARHKALRIAKGLFTLDLQKTIKSGS